VCVCVVSVDHTCMICVPFLKLVNDLMTSWFISSIAFFQSLLKPRTSCVTFPTTHTHTHTHTVATQPLMRRSAAQQQRVDTVPAVSAIPWSLVFGLRDWQVLSHLFTICTGTMEHSRLMGWFD